jgi:hypothetical protein
MACSMNHSEPKNPKTDKVINPVLPVSDHGPRFLSGCPIDGRLAALFAALPKRGAHHRAECLASHDLEASAAI